MAVVNTTSITPILKVVYEGPIAGQIQEETILTQRIESSNSGVVHKAGGRYVDFPVLVGRNQGISFRQEAETLGDFGRARYKEVQVPLYSGYGRTRINGQIFEIAETDKQAFANAVTNEMEVLKNSVVKDQNRIYYGTGDGRLALILSTGTLNTVTVDDAVWLEIDAVIDVMTLAGALVGAGARNVTAVDYDLNTVTFDGAGAAVVSGTHMITRAGNFAAGVQREPTGLGKMIDNTVNLFGVNDPMWKANVVTNVGAISEMAITAVLDQARRRGGKPTAMFYSLGVRRAYFALLAQQRRFNDTVTFGGGFEALKFTYGSRVIPLVEDPDCPKGRLYAIPEKDMRVYHTKDWHFEDRTGAMFVQVPNVDAYDVLMKRYFELAIRRRNGLAALTGITEA